MKKYNRVKEKHFTNGPFGDLDVMLVSPPCSYLTCQRYNVTDPFLCLVNTQVFVFVHLK